MASLPEEPGHDPLARFVGFGHVLRQEGLAAGSGQVLAYCRAVARLDPSDLNDLYWAGRACLVSKREDVEGYDRAFRSYFLGRENVAAVTTAGRPPPWARAPSPFAAVPGATREGPEERSVGTVASTAEVLRRKRFSECSPEELAVLRRLVAALRVAPPLRRTRRTSPARRGRYPDLRHTVRRALKTEGEILHRAWRRRRIHPRRIVLILDVSGSMAEYSRTLLQFAHSTSAGARRVEVFCFGTRLTRVTEALRRHDPDAALEKAAGAVVDWDGGTRIGESLGEFVRSWGRRGLARGALLVICSDGLERGDPEVLGTEMARLSRLAHRIVWVNPLKGDPAYEPLARGMRAALPFVDLFVSGHDLASLQKLAGLIPSLR